MEWMLLPYRRYAEFSGRSRRLEFWMFNLLNMIIFSIAGGLMLAGGLVKALTNPGSVEDPTTFGFGPSFWIGVAILVVVFLGSIVPGLAVTVRRLHDRGLSGWWYVGAVVLGNIPYIGFLINLALIVILAMPGDRGPNRYGPDPLDPSRVDVFA